MAATKPRQFRLSNADIADIDAIAHEWCPANPFTRTHVLAELVRREKARLARVAKKSAKRNPDSLSVS